ncbi:hypothetical protein MKQ70_01630 [Chitinophaga sedimenti]|uniref:hypothetical protein n=1 Tax=Chitinophaga sedimenti TaxID=2033606 RepID=UPI0020045928|nr:hypothetical protein [Chitinophaga sedimenti]MCK7553771.1 hypothetical protein [Chitinophaga sedimenti]
MKLRSWLLVIFSLAFTAGFAQSSIMKYGDTSRKGLPYAKDPHVVSFKGRYLLYFSIPPFANDPQSGWNIGIAESKDLINWNKIGEVRPAPGAKYEEKGLCAPGAIVRNDTVHLFYQTYGNGKKTLSAMPGLPTASSSPAMPPTRSLNLPATGHPAAPLMRK